MSKNMGNISTDELISFLDGIEKETIHRLSKKSTGDFTDLMSNPTMVGSANLASSCHNDELCSQLNSLMKNDALNLRNELFSRVRDITHKYENKYLSTLNGVVVQHNAQEAEDEWLREMDDMESECQKQAQSRIHDTFTKIKGLSPHYPDSGNDIASFAFKIFPLYGGVTNIFLNFTSDAGNLIKNGINDTWKGINNAFDDVGHFIDSIF